MVEIGRPPPNDAMDNDIENAYQNAIHSQFVGQWITSLAISVICCAILFVVFSSYIVQLQDKANLANVRLEVMQEKYNQLSNDIDVLRRAQPQAVFNIQGMASRVETPSSKETNILLTPQAADKAAEPVKASGSAPEMEQAPPPSAPAANK